MKYFSPYSLIPQKEAIIAEERQKPLKTEYLPRLKRDLKPGWLMSLLYNYDAIMYGRWEYWQNLQLVPKEKVHLITKEEDPNNRLENIQQFILPEEPIPHMEFDTTYTQGDLGRKMLDICLDKMLTKGGYINVMTRIEYFLDWLLFGFGHPHPWFRQLPPEPSCCEGASMILYQLFNLFPLLDKPKDYWGYLIADAKGKGSQQHTGYFPTPNTVAHMMNKMMFCSSKDRRLERMCEPSVGTGVMTLEPSNHLLSAVGIDIDKIVLKACLVNWYLYCPWFAVPIWYLVGRTDLMWGNAFLNEEDEAGPKSIHQKYWLERFDGVYPIAIEEKDWQKEMQKIIDFMPKPPEPPEIKPESITKTKTKTKSKRKGAKKKSTSRSARPKSQRKSKPLF